MAQVELVVDEPARLVAIVTADAVEELGLKPGMPADRGRQGDVGDGGARMRLAARRRSLAAVAGRRRARPRSTTTRATVFAAASLTDVFPTIAPNARYSFAGSNALAAQIRHGAPADVFASANTTLPTALHAEGFCSKPVVFTRNTLVVIVPSVEPGGDQERLRPGASGIKLVIAAPGVPVGSYTLQILKNMNLSSVLTNVVSQETDVREVLAKVALGRGRRRLRLLDRRADGARQGEGAQGPGLGAAEGAVRDLRRLREPEQGRRAGVHQARR